MTLKKKPETEKCLLITQIEEYFFPSLITSDININQISHIPSFVLILSDCLQIIRRLSKIASLQVECLFRNSVGVDHLNLFPGVSLITLGVRNNGVEKQRSYIKHFRNPLLRPQNTSSQKNNSRFNLNFLLLFDVRQSNPLICALNFCLTLLLM